MWTEESSKRYAEWEGRAYRTLMIGKFAWFALCLSIANLIFG